MDQSATPRLSKGVRPPCPKAKRRARRSMPYDPDGLRLRYEVVTSGHLVRRHVCHSRIAPGMGSAASLAFRRGGAEAGPCSVGEAPAPRSWDHRFSEQPVAYLRVRTDSGEWLGGLFASQSYPGGFPHEADLLLEETWRLSDDGALFEASLGIPSTYPLVRSRAPAVTRG